MSTDARKTKKTLLKSTLIPASIASDAQLYEYLCSANGESRAVEVLCELGLTKADATSRVVDLWLSLESVVFEGR